MRVFLKDLSKDKQKAIKSILNGNGLTMKDCNLYRDGSAIAIEIKHSGQIIKLD